MTISGKALVAGVMGWPVSHSRSPRLHGFWLEAYGIDGAYVPLSVAPEDFEQALRALPSLGLRGCNVTLPHKEQTLALADEADEGARRIGAGNTVVVTDEGAIRVTNTDAFGFLENLEQRAPAWPVDRPAVVLGAGGASRAVIVGLLEAGVRELRLANRTAERAEGLADEFGEAVVAVAWDERDQALDGAGLVVNTTRLGMTGQPPLGIALDPLGDDAVVCDLVYAPLKTDLLHRSAARHLRTVDGLGMLLHQARPGFAAWFGREPEVTGALYAYVAEGL
ncbi:MAG: shikimate dehydrogenase [Rhodospirillales bacterium]|nr:shikimate dehydrogenase [Rhodospirillales bacterium]